jgi:hypothetical protein
MQPTLNLATNFLMLRIDSHKLNMLMDECRYYIWRMSAVTRVTFVCSLPNLDGLLSSTYITDRDY